MMIERTEFNDGTVRIHDDRFRPGQNLMRRASLAKAMSCSNQGRRTQPAAIGLLAEVGRGAVRTIGPVLVGILSTGNELVAGQ